MVTTSLLDCLYLHVCPAVQGLNLLKEVAISPPSRALPLVVEAARTWQASDHPSC